MKRHEVPFNFYIGLLLGLSMVLTTGCLSSRPAAETEAASAEEAGIGRGEQMPKPLAGTVASISGEEAEGQPVRHLEELLQGRVAGVQVYQAVDGSIAVRVRGTTTFNGSSEPLFMIDGSPVTPGPGGALAGLNPSDVEKIEVLKGAASAALYGSRAAHGVVLVTTKRDR